MGVRTRWGWLAFALAAALLGVTATQASATVQFTRAWAGAPEFNQPWGVAVDQFGHAYVADSNNARIEEVDADGNLIRAWGSFGVGDGQMKSPASVALDAAGNVYVADLGNHRIDEFTPTGTFVRTWGWGVSNGTPALQTCTAGCQAGIAGSGDGQLSSPKGIAFDGDGNAYVAETGNNRIQEFDATASRGFVTKWGSLGTGAGQFDNPFAVDVDGSGNVYVADTANNRIQKFTPPAVAGNPPVFDRMWGKGVDQTSSTDVCTALSGDICAAGAGASAEGQFVTPRGVATDASGNLYVADSGNERIQKLDASGAFVSTWGYGVSDNFPNYEICTSNCHSGISGSAAPGQFNFPLATAVSPAGDVYVADANNSRVQVFQASGDTFPSVASRFGGPGSDGDFGGAAGLAKDSSDHLIVADSLTNRISKFNSDGARLGTVAGPGSDNGQVLGPTGVATDASGNTYIADAGNQRIQKLDGSNFFVAMWGKGVNQSTPGNVCTPSDTCQAGTAGSGDGEFNDPAQVAVDPSGNVYVADLNNDRIQKFTSQGFYLTQWGTHGSGDGQLDAPQGVAVDSAGNVYVADSNNHRVDVFSDTGTFKRAWGYGVQNGANNFQVCTSGCQAGLSGSGDGELIAPKSVATDAFNNVYVPDCSRDDVQMFRPTGQLVKKWGSSGNGDGQFDCPGYVATDGSLIYVSDFEGARVEKFTETDTILPETTLDPGPSDPTNDSTPEFSFSSSEPSGALFECRLDASGENAYQACSSPFTTPPLSDGSHTFEVRSIDAAGNPDASPATDTFTVDTTPPDTSIASGPSGPSRDRTPTYGFTSTEGSSTFMCRVDLHPLAPCGSPKTAGPLADGPHTFYVKATDAAGNTDASPAHRTLKVDTHRPTSTASAPAATHRSPFNVTYTASDPGPATGLALVELWVHRPGHPGYAKVATDSTPGITRAFRYRPRAGAGTYRFFTRAKDKATNYEPLPASSDASTAWSP